MMDPKLTCGFMRIKCSIRVLGCFFRLCITFLFVFSCRVVLIVCCCGCCCDCGCVRTLLFFEGEAADPVIEL